MNLRGIGKMAAALAAAAMLCSCSVQDLVSSLTGSGKEEQAPPLPAQQYVRINLEDDGSKALMCVFSMKTAGDTCYDQLEVKTVGFEAAGTNVAPEKVNRYSYGAYAAFPPVNLAPYVKASSKFEGLPSQVMFSFSKSEGTAAANGTFYANWQTRYTRGVPWQYNMSGIVVASADEASAPPMRIALTPALKLVARQVKSEKKIEIGLTLEDKGIAVYCNQNNQEAEASVSVTHASGRSESVKKAGMSQFAFG